MRVKCCVLVLLLCLALFPLKVLAAATMVPARMVLESNGYTIEWNGQGITATNGRKTLEIPLNKNIITVDGNEVAVDEKTVIVFNQMYVSQNIFNLLGIPTGETLVPTGPALTLKAGNMLWDVKSCSDISEFYALNSTEGLHWLVPAVNQDLIGGIYNYFSNIYNQSAGNYRLASNAYQFLTDNYSKGINVISLPVEERLSRAVINFDASYAYNKNNMNAVVALQYLDGKVVPSGQVFSYNKEVGPRTLKRGFYVGYSISGSKLVPDVGGGVCRASTALYNAVLDAKLPVVERHPHSEPVSYVPKGRDATVAWNIYDFKFKNNLNEPIKISTQGSTTMQLIAELWKIIP